MKENAKKATAVIAALVTGLSLPSCSWSEAGASTGAHEQLAPEQESRLIQVACDLGWPRQKLEEMGEQGLVPSDAKKLMRASQMLDHLEDKYGTSFKATELSSPSVTGSTWRMRARAQADPYVGEEVECRWLKDQASPTDDFLSRVRSDELEELMAGIVEEVSSQVGAQVVYGITTAHLQVGDEADLATPVEELSRHVCPWVWIYFARDSQLGDEGLKVFASSLSAALADKDMGGGFHMRRLLTGSEGASLTLGEAQEVARTGTRGKDWELVYTGSAEGWGE